MLATISSNGSIAIAENLSVTHPMHSDDASTPDTHDSASPVVDEIVERAVREATGISEAARGRINGLLRRRLTPLELWLRIRAIIDDMSPDLERVMAGALLAGKLTGRSHVAVLLPDADYAPVDPERFLTFPVEGVKRWRFPQVEEAARFLAEKRVMLPGEYSALDAEAKQEAFTIAGVGSTDALAKIRRALVEDVAQGGTLKEFRAKVEAATGGTALSPAHIETIYRTNVAQAYREGQQRMMAHPLVADEFPYIAAEGIDDVRRRPEHRWFNTGGIQGTNIFRVDDPVYRKFFLPWGWNCRCVSVFLSREDAAKRGIKEAQVWVDTGVRPDPPAFVAPPPFDLPPGWEKPTLNLSLDLANVWDDWQPLRDSQGKLPAWYSPTRRKYRYQVKRPESRGPGTPGAMRTRPVSQQQKIGPAPATPPGTASPVLPAPPKLPTPSVPNMIPAAGPVAAPLPQKANTAMPIQQQGGPQAGPMPPELEQARAAIVKAALDANPNHPVSNPAHDFMAVRLNNRFVNTITSPMDAADHKAMQDLHSQIGMEYQNRGDHERALGQFAAARFHYDGAEKQGGDPEATPVDDQLVTKDQQAAQTPATPAPAAPQAQPVQQQAAPAVPQAVPTPAPPQPAPQQPAPAPAPSPQTPPVRLNATGSPIPVSHVPANQADILRQVAQNAQNIELDDSLMVGRGVGPSLKASGPEFRATIQAMGGHMPLYQQWLKDNPVGAAKIPPDVATQFQGHGTFTVETLGHILNNGIDKNRTFHSEDLASINGKGGNELLRDSAPFMVISHPNKMMPDGGISAVAVDGHHYSSIPHLEKAFPGVRFIKASDLPEHLTKELQKPKPSPQQQPAPQPSQQPAPKPPAPPVQAQPVKSPQAIPVAQQKPPAPPPQATPVPVPPKPPMPPVQQAATPPQPQAQRPAPQAPQQAVPPHAQNTSAWFKKHLDAATHLPEHVRQEYHNATHEVLRRMPQKAVERFEKHAKSVTFHADRKALGQHIIDQYGSDLDAARIDKLQKGKTAGFYHFENREIILDGGAKLDADFTGGNRRTVHETYAHEMTHAIDGPKNRLSKSQGWMEAWKEEIAHSPVLSKYAQTRVEEGFAEFGRMLYGTDTDRKLIEAKFPKASTFFKRLGLWQ